VIAIMHQAAAAGSPVVHAMYVLEQQVTMSIRTSELLMGILLSILSVRPLTSLLTMQGRYGHEELGGVTYPGIVHWSYITPQHSTHARASHSSNKGYQACQSTRSRTAPLLLRKEDAN